MRGLPLAVLLLAAVVLSCALVSRASDDDTGRVAVANTSYVSDDATWLRRLVERADDAIGKKDWATAVRVLQEIVETKEDPNDPGAAAPQVLPVYGSVVFEGAWIVAHHRILAAGTPALDAYATAYTAPARLLLDRALAGRDRDLLAEIACRWLPLEEGREAALLLAGLALENGDRDRALEWLERLETLEEVTAEPEATLAPWRRARIRLQAAVLGRTDNLESVERFLDQTGDPKAPARIRYAPVPAADRAPVPALEAWSTTGGNAARSGIPEALGTRFELAWHNPLQTEVEAEDPDTRHARPSIWLPAAAVVDDDLAFVSDGDRLFVWGLGSGDLKGQYDVSGTRGGVGLSRVSEEDARQELGLIEGHALTLGPKTPEGRIVYLAAPDPARADWWDYDPDHNLREDELVALRWTGRRIEPLWRRGGLDDPGLDDDEEETPPHPVSLRGVRLYGAPLLYRDRVWMGGVRASRGSDHEADLWLFGFDPLSGAVAVRTYLGSSPPVRPARPDEGIPSSPAGANGRVVLSTSMGIVAAVDARTGRPEWILRNDRGVVGRGRPRRLMEDQDKKARESGFENRPPLLAYERVWVAPTDGPLVICLFDRPRGRERHLVNFAADRRRDFGTAAGELAVEQLTGLHPGGGGLPPRLIVAGKGQASEGQPPAPIALAVDPFTLAPHWAAIASTGDGPERYGTALLTRGELFVPTRNGISIFELESGNAVTTLDMASLDPAWRDLVGPEIPLSGNLIPAPGHGLLVLSGTHAVFWRIKR